MQLIGPTNNNLLLQDQVDHLTIDEFHALLKAADKKFESLKRSSVRNLYIRDRNKLLLIVLWATGGRISDVLSIQESNVDYDRKLIKFYVQKRKKWHVISIDSDTTLKIANYVRTWHISGYLFKGVGKDSDKQLTRQYTDRILKDLSKIAGIRPVHAHLFRHGLATYLLSKGVPLEVIAYRLKHANTRTTAQFYARMTADIERQLIDSCVPDILGDID